MAKKFRTPMHYVDRNLLINGRFERLTEEEKQDLVLKAQEGDKEARNAFIESEVPFVRMIARKLRKIYHTAGITEEDAFTHGIFGLGEALEGFDPSNGVKFETYAGNRVKGAILDAAREFSGFIKIPRLEYTAVSKWRTSEKLLRKKLGRDPTEDEISEHSGITPDRYVEAGDGIKRHSNFLDVNYKRGDSDERSDFLALRKISNLGAKWDVFDEIERREIVEYVLGTVDAAEGSRKLITRSSIAYILGIDDESSREIFPKVNNVTQYRLRRYINEHGGDKEALDRLEKTVSEQKSKERYVLESIILMALQ